MKTSAAPFLSAVLTTRNRAALLNQALASLCHQTLERENFEVVVVDDGSTDSTAEVVQSYHGKMPLIYAYQRPAGLNAARNHGIFMARGKCVLFLDDDDVSDSGMLHAHAEAHARYQDRGLGVLGFTGLTPDLERDPLMHYLTRIGGELFSYSGLRGGSVLPFEYFWGGRSSCKRSFLLDFGIFACEDLFGCEDIELAFRLSRRGFKVVYEPRAILTMMRRLSLHDVCARTCVKGKSSYRFSQLHADPQVQAWAQVQTIRETWPALKSREALIRASARELDAIARERMEKELPLSEDFKSLLYRGYKAVIELSRMQGFMAAEACLPPAMIRGSPALRAPGGDCKSHCIFSA
jgi:glycosyltransferase involved in cell wall biosynthesis